jgi:hypothetical protein
MSNIVDNNDFECIDNSLYERINLIPFTYPSIYENIQDKENKNEEDDYYYYNFYYNSKNNDIDINRVNNQLKGILKNKKNENIISENENMKYYDKYKVIHTIYILISILILTPFIFCDIYYVLCDNLCIVNYYEQTVNIYLYVSFSIGLMNILLLTLYIYYNSSVCFIFSIITNICAIIWNIFASVIFWYSFYNRNTCDNSLYNYLMISIIVKIIINSLYVFRLPKVFSKE